MHKTDREKKCQGDVNLWIYIAKEKATYAMAAGVKPVNERRTIVSE